MEAQVAMRHEILMIRSHLQSEGRIAELSDDVLLRGSKSTSFRVPNLIQANQLYVTRSGNVDDVVGEYVG